MKKKYFTKIILLFCAAFLISGCNKNDDATMLYSYPKFGHCTIDSPARGATIQNNGDLIINGWAYDEKRGNIPEILTLYFIHEKTNEIIATSVKRGDKREDVAQILRNPALVNSGFSGSIERKKLTPGRYILILLQADRDSGVISCAGEPHTFTLK